MEMLVAMFIAMLIMSATLYMYVQGRAFMEKPRASYSVQEDLMKLSRWIQRDLAETNLQTVQSFPSNVAGSEPPGLCFESPRRMGDDALMFTPWGNVSWQKYVYYTLQPVNALTGNIVRIEGPLTDQPTPIDAGRHIPIVSGKTPSRASGGSVIARNVILPNVKVLGFADFDQYGGFKITTGLPGGPYVPLTGKNTYDEPIRIELAVLEISTTTGKTSALTMRLQVQPKN